MGSLALNAYKPITAGGKYIRFNNTTIIFPNSVPSDKDSRQSLSECDGGTANYSGTAGADGGVAASVRAVWGGADAVRGSEHVKPERGLSGGGNGAGEDVQVVGSSLLQCPQEGCGDEHGDWEQIVFGLAVAGHDEEIFGRESRAVRRVERGAPPSTLWCLGEGAVEQCLGRCRGVAHAGNHPYFRYATFTWATYSTPALVLTERAGELFAGEGVGCRTDAGFEETLASK